jgi:hypothetical protein
MIYYYIQMFDFIICLCFNIIYFISLVGASHTLHTGWHKQQKFISKISESRMNKINVPARFHSETSSVGIETDSISSL